MSTHYHKGNSRLPRSHSKTAARRSTALPCSRVRCPSIPSFSASSPPLARLLLRCDHRFYSSLSSRHFSKGQAKQVTSCPTSFSALSHPQSLDTPWCATPTGPVLG